MMNNAFSRPATAAIHYELLHQTPLGPQHVTSSGTATLLVEEKLERQSQIALKVGDEVQTGQKITPFTDRPTYAISASPARFHPFGPCPEISAKTSRPSTLPWPRPK
jgi:hypothetical protein